MAKPATEGEASILTRIIANGGEALRDGPHYYAGGRNICDRGTMERMARKGLVRIDKVGQSSFAVPLGSLSVSL